jgi:hypothetical protein
MTTSPKIGTLNEKPLHAALKQWYAQPGDRFEAPVDGYVIDLVRGELLIEIQTTSFAALKRKLADLVARHPVRLVYPVAQDRWLLKLAPDGSALLGRRKSPWRGALEHVFEELVSFPQLLAEANFSLHALLIQEEQVRRYDAGRAWRRKGWVVQERRLLQVLGGRLFETPADMGALLPPALVQPFSVSDLASANSQPRRLAQKMAYCLREMGAIEAVGKRGNAILYTRIPALSG